MTRIADRIIVFRGVIPGREKSLDGLAHTLHVRREELKASIFDAMIKDQRIIIVPQYVLESIRNLNRSANDLVDLVSDAENKHLRILKLIQIDLSKEQSFASQFADAVNELIEENDPVGTVRPEVDSKVIKSLTRDGQTAIFLILPHEISNVYYFGRLEIVKEN